MSEHLRVDHIIAMGHRQRWVGAGLSRYIQTYSLGDDIQECRRSSTHLQGVLRCQVLSTVPSLDSCPKLTAFESV